MKNGVFSVVGLKIGNVFLGIQPVLGNFYIQYIHSEFFCIQTHTYITFDLIKLIYISDILYLPGVEGDPMRMLFERDLTPHPQYAAYYMHLQEKIQPHAVVHFGKRVFVYVFNILKPILINK